MRKTNLMRALIFLFFLTIISCTETGTLNQINGGDGQPCYSDGTCDTGLTCVSDICVDPGESGDEPNEKDDENQDTAKPDTEKPDENNENNDGCDTGSVGKNCSLDNECGKCNICVKGKCATGCTSDDDCRMYTGLKCNKKLYRCTNVYASLQACGETKCPTGCCYSEAGLTTLKCITTPDASKCGLCANGEIYMPDKSQCIPAVCSTTSDNCETLNSASTDPKPECFECKSGEFICKEKPNCDSSSVLVNAAKCIPAGQKCVAGVSECCSGMPCVEGYCY